MELFYHTMTCKTAIRPRLHDVLIPDVKSVSLPHQIWKLLLRLLWFVTPVPSREHVKREVAFVRVQALPFRTVDARYAGRSDMPIR